MFLRTLALAAVSAVAALPAVQSQMLVSTDWLAQHLTDSNLAIVHVGANRTGYEAGHIPGARFLAQGSIAVAKNGVPNELPPVADLKAALEAAGIGDGSRVIFYADGSVLPATRAWFTLDYLGHGGQGALLDGGLAKWKSENRSVTNAEPAPAKASLTPKPQSQLVYSTDAVKELSAKAAANRTAAPGTLLDVRPATDFAGEKGAHIPGSAHAYWMDGQASNTDSSLKSEDALRKLYAAAGITPGKPVVVYCNSGMQASQSYFALKYLGYDARLYDGSMSEWNSQKLPTEK